MVDPFQFTKEELYIFSRSEQFCQMLVRADYGYLCSRQPTTLIPLHPIRYKAKIGWIYQVEFKDRIYGDKLIEFAVLAPRDARQQVVICWPTGYGAAKDLLIGPVEYMALVLAAQEG